MLRVLFYLVIVAALGFGFSWLADRPGVIDVVFAGNHYTAPLITAAAAVVGLAAAVLILWWVLKSVVLSPYALRRHMRNRKRDRGYHALSTGLIAAGAGDAEAARGMTRQAGKLLGAEREPLIRLLAVQTAMLEGRSDDARKGFEAMLEHPETKLLGLRGLYIEAQRAGAMEAARAYAEAAVKEAPQLEWASSAVMGKLCAEGDWDAALRLVDARRQVLAHGKDTVKTERAALLTARAMATIDTDRVHAKADALEAHKLAPELVPAAVAAARALLAEGDVRRGSKILEAAWRRAPHPDVAAVYIHARAGDTAQDRLKRARRLVSLRANTAEGSLALARAAYEAGEYRLARETVEQVMRAAPRESAWLLMADIEEAETGDQGKVRQWLAQAVKAPRDPAWTADGYVSEQWSPVSPLTGRLNSFEWRVPVERIAPVIDVEKPEIRGPAPAIAHEPAPPPAPAPTPVVVEAAPAPAPVPEAEPVIVAPPAADVPAPEKPEAEAERPLRVVDDPGVDEEGEPRKAQGGLRLF